MTKKQKIVLELAITLIRLNKHKPRSKILWFKRNKSGVTRNMALTISTTSKIDVITKFI